MTSTRRTASTVGGLVMSTLSALMLVTACEQPLPQELSRGDAGAGAPSTARVDLEPTFLPYTTPPSIDNRDEVVAALRGGYPALLREAGVGGTVRVHFYIDAEGLVRSTRIDESSGHAALDGAALRVAEAFRFRPALNGTEPTPVWVSLPISFQPRQ